MTKLRTSVPELGTEEKHFFRRTDRRQVLSALGNGSFGTNVEIARSRAAAPDCSHRRPLRASPKVVCWIFFSAVLRDLQTAQFACAPRGRQG